MSDDLILKCLIAFVLGFLIARMMRGDGFSIGGLKKCNINNLEKDVFCDNDGPVDQSIFKKNLIMLDKDDTCGMPKNTRQDLYNKLSTKCKGKSHSQSGREQGERIGNVEHALSDAWRGQLTQDDMNDIAKWSKHVWTNKLKQGMPEYNPSSVPLESAGY